MKKGRAEMDIHSVITSMELKLRVLEEIGEASTSRDAQAIAAAKITGLSELIESARACRRLSDFKAIIVEELKETECYQNICRNPYLIAGFQVQIGILEMVLRILGSELARKPSRSALFGLAA